MVVIGCDIHCYMETYNSNTGLWEKAGNIFNNRWYPQYDKEPKTDEPICDRHYMLFGILAGVRNGEVTPISKPRDLPDDVSEEVESKSEEWGVDGHSHSYLTVKEILDYDWNQTYETTARMGLDEYTKYFNAGKKDPAKYTTYKLRPNEFLISESEMEKVMNSKEEMLKAALDNKDPHCVIQYDEKYSVACKKLLIILDEIVEMGNPEDMRFVFWFDN